MKQWFLFVAIYFLSIFYLSLNKTELHNKLMEQICFTKFALPET